jgi:ATP-dependent protease HslVU (ClpYQ) peptidase subunit
MTVIIADKTRNGTVVIGADSRETIGEVGISLSAVPKIKRLGHYILGGAGDGGLAELLIESWKIPACPHLITGDFIQRNVRRSLLEFLQSHHIVDDHFNFIIPKESEADFLLVIDNRMWHIALTNNEKGNGIDFLECSFPYAIGSGADFSLGALYALTGKTEQRIKKAIEITSLLCNSVDNNVIILKGEQDEN